MKAFKKFLYMVTAVAAFATGCTEQIEYDPAPKENGQQVSFAFDQKTKFSVEESTTLEFGVVRVLDTTDYTVDVNFKSESDAITLASKPVFKAGEKTAVLTVDVDINKLEVGETAAVLMTLVGELSTYGDSTLEFAVTRPAPKSQDPNWESIGVGMYRDDVLLPLWGADPGLTWEVEIAQHKQNPNLYRVLNPYSEEILVSIFGNYSDYGLGISETEGYIEFDVTDPNAVVLSETPLGFLLDAGEGLEERYIYPMDGAFGVFSDGVFTFPTKGMALINEAGNGFYANSNGMFAVILPGAELLDASLEVKYVGKYVSADNASASAVLDFTLGTDVESYIFTVVEGDVTADYSAVVAGMKDGSIEVTESSIEQTRWEVALSAAGQYTVVAIPFAAGEMKDGKAIAYRFYFPGADSAELPEVEVKVAVDSVVGITGDESLEADYPSSETACIYIEAPAAEIEAISYFFGSGVPADVTNEEVLSAYGKDASSFIADMAESGYALLVFQGLTPETTYDVIIGVKTVYGELKTFRAAYTTEAAAAAAAAAMTEYYPAQTSYIAQKLVF